MWNVTVSVKAPGSSTLAVAVMDVPVGYPWVSAGLVSATPKAAMSCSET